MSQRQVLGEILVAFGEYYDKRLTTNQLAMYIEDLIDLTAEELRHACKAYRQDPKNDRFPLPAKLISLARPKESPEDVGRDTAAAIIDAVFRAGWNNPEKAKGIMGDLGWAIVSRMGGWQNFCQDLTNENLPTMRAQLRDLAATMARREERGIMRTDNQIAQGTAVSGLISDLAKKAEVDK